MIHLRARVPRKGIGDSPGNEGTGSENSAHIPIPDWVEIEQIPQGFLLSHVYLRPCPFVHTWHATVEEAKEEAKSDFLVVEDEWEDLSSDDRTE